MHIFLCPGFNDPDTIDKRLLINVGDTFCCCLPRRWQNKLHIADDVTDDEYKHAEVKVRMFNPKTAKFGEPSIFSEFN